MNVDGWIRLSFSSVAALGMLLSSGCKSIVRERTVVPKDLVDQAEIPGMPGVRFWGDIVPPDHDAWEKASDEEIKEHFSGVYGVPHVYLGISGGGANGAYGAGVLKGWTATGKRPKFVMVTGISTGSIIAPFAFLGPEYDAVLELLYGGGMSTDDVLEERSIMTGIRGDAFTDLTPLRTLLSEKITDVEVEKIAAEHRKGRRLYLGTVNVDTLRPVTWDIGRIASSGDPAARDLILDIITASASIPIAFPPVFIDVEVDGKMYQEMHVDGGLAAQVFVYPSSLDWKEVTERLKPKGTPHVYVIRNARLDPEWEAVEAKIMPLASRTISSMIRTQGIGDLEEIALATERDGMDMSLAYIPADFKVESNEAFDPDYMSALFKLGEQRVADGTVWKNRDHR